MYPLHCENFCGVRCASASASRNNVLVHQQRKRCGIPYPVRAVSHTFVAMEPGAEAAFVIPEYAELQPLDASATIFTATDLAVPDDDAPLLFSTLNAVRQVAAHHDVTCTVTGVAGLELFVVAQIANLRSAISRCAVIAASELATVYGANICGRPSVDLFVSSLLVKASGDKRFIRDPAQQALRNLVAGRFTPCDSPPGCNITPHTNNLPPSSSQCGAPLPSCTRPSCAMQLARIVSPYLSLPS